MQVWVARNIDASIQQANRGAPYLVFAAGEFVAEVRTLREAKSAVPAANEWSTR
jgi:hypothetical protein